MELCAIMAATRDLVIGNSTNVRDFMLPWPKSAQDMAHFRRLTFGEVVIMGRRTFQAMGSKPLPDRYNVVLSRDPSFARFWTGRENAPFVCASLEDAEKTFAGFPRAWIIGGAQVYAQALEKCSRLELSIFTTPYTGDVKLNDIGPFSNLEPTERKAFDAGWFLTYRR